ncbi:calcyclin-binding protein-like [Tubulanus polymorphus]|uniref:calcyclin-binding protein-like n=1 Tax=Tubulanus polymorphus TaxID=672921 RepID=UPI003DA41BDA
MSSYTTTELKADVDELKKFLTDAQRKRVKELLSIEVRKLETELSKKLEEESKNGNASESVKKATTPIVSSGCSKTITNYGWDQSDKFFKIYVTLNGVQNLEKDQVVSNFTERSVKLQVNNLNGENHCLSIGNLHSNISPSGSYHKVKTDCILLMLKKQDAGKKWENVTPVTKTKTDTPASAPNLGDDSDPSAGIMNLMKKMYEEGDDEMKRTINKAWSESQDKKNAGLGEMPM